MLKNLLLYRFVILNSLIFCAAFAAIWAGLATPIYATDASHITKAITVVFAVGWCWTAYEIWRIGKARNDAKSYDPIAGRTAERDKAAAKLAWLGDVSEWLVSLGLLGTVIGFWMALPSGAVGTDVASVQSTIASLMAGMRTALGTTILGAILAVWHQVNLRLLMTAFSGLWEDRIIKRERIKDLDHEAFRP